MAKKRSKPSALTTMGIYLRHLSKAEGVNEEALQREIDFLPGDGVIRLPLSSLPAPLQEAAAWEAIDKAASHELGQPVVTTLADGFAVVNQKQS